MKTKQLLTNSKFGWILVALGSVGFLASLVLSYEKLAVAMDPSRVPSCSINPVIDCGAAMNAGSDTLLYDIPNAFLGIGAFGALAAIGVALLAGASFKAWFWKLFYAITLFGMGVVVFFVYESLYQLGALCLYCMVTWAVVIPLFVYTTIFLEERKLLKVPKFMHKAWPVIKANHIGVVVALFLVVFVLSLFRFRDYFETLI